MSHSIRKAHYGLLPPERGYSGYRFDTRKLTNYRHDATNPNSLSNNNVNNITQDSKGNLCSPPRVAVWTYIAPQAMILKISTRRGMVWPVTAFMKRKNLPAAANYCSSPTKGSPSSTTKIRLLIITVPKTASRWQPSTKNALCVTCDGEIFLGGIQGMISFHEMELNFTPKSYKIILSRLIVNGREILCRR